MTEAARDNERTVAVAAQKLRGEVVATATIRSGKQREL
jgi:hypothetical protein